MRGKAVPTIVWSSAARNRASATPTVARIRALRVISPDIGVLLRRGFDRVEHVCKRSAQPRALLRRQLREHASDALLHVLAVPVELPPSFGSELDEHDATVVRVLEALGKPLSSQRIHELGKRRRGHRAALGELTAAHRSAAKNLRAPQVGQRAGGASPWTTVPQDSQRKCFRPPFAGITVGDSASRCRMAPSSPATRSGSMPAPVWSASTSLFMSASRRSRASFIDRPPAERIAAALARSAFGAEIELGVALLLRLRRPAELGRIPRIALLWKIGGRAIARRFLELFGIGTRRGKVAVTLVVLATGGKRAGGLVLRGSPSTAVLLGHAPSCCTARASAARRELGGFRGRRLLGTRRTRAREVRKPRHEQNDHVRARAERRQT